MADYYYRIYAGANNTAPNFTRPDLAVADFGANDRTSSGTAGRVAANSTLYFKIDGFIDSVGYNFDLGSIDATTNANAAIVVEPYSNPWNATARAIGYTTAFDGMLFTTGSQMTIGGYSTRVGNCTVRDLIISGTFAVTGWSPAGGGSQNKLVNCFIRNNHATAAACVELYGIDMLNCVLYQPNASTAEPMKGSSLTRAMSFDNITLICPGGAPNFYNNQGDPLPIIRNSYIGGTFTNGYVSAATNSAWSSSCVNNAVSTATTWTGPTGTKNSIALSTTNFENVTDGSEDFRVKATSTLNTTDRVTRLAAPANVDIFNTSRADPATIGAFEYAAENAAPTFSGTISNINASQSVAITPVDVSSLFSDPGDTLAYSKSAGGTTWPTGLDINSGTGVISGTIDTVGTTTGCKVTATDTADQTVDSNAFNVIVAAAGTITTGSLKNNTGTLLANETDVVVFVHDVDTGEVVYSVTDATSDSSGVVTISDASIVADTAYRCVFRLSSGAEGMETLTAT